MIQHIFFDIGGVLGTNGWDHEQRARLVARFGLDAEDFEYRHQETVGAWEEGRMSTDEYLDITIFDRVRPFTREEVRAFMRDQSRPDLAAIAVARAVAEHSDGPVMALNNESEELNLHRIESFGLRDIFAAFLSSCWLGYSKPSRRFYERAFAIAQADPRASLFIDDREQNLAPARAMGVTTLRFESAPQLEMELRRLGALP
ncbi:MAG: HAD family phosphatase [Gemmatimonadota bacterium]|nr:HAD family phosphatase [Gemmatimonadota bacterium]